MAEYHVLDKENVDFLMGLTGLTETELRTKYEESELFGHKLVFWKVLNRWYSIKVSGEYVHYGLLDRIVKEAIEVTVREYPHVVRRDPVLPERTNGDGGNAPDYRKFP